MERNICIQESERLTACQLSEMANNDLEKYAKAIDRYVKALLCFQQKMLIRYQCHYEIPFIEDGGSERHHAALVEQDVPGDW